MSIARMQPTRWIVWGRSLLALGIAGAIILPTLRTVAGFHGELVWPENVTCGHEPGQVG